MFFFKKPSPVTIQHILKNIQNAPFSYPEHGRTQGIPPPKYNIDRYHVILGKGQDVFDKACKGINQWKMFDNGWTEIICLDQSINTNTLAGILIKVGFLWNLNFARVVYVINENNENKKQFGFAYGTLDQHVERGEERFLAEWNKSSNAVSYQILAFSKPKHLLAWLAYPYVRLLQKKFGHDSLKAMKRISQ